MSTVTKRLRLLRAVYDALPTVECKGLCHAQCSVAPLHELELVQLEKAALRKLPVLNVPTPPGTAILKPLGVSCPLLVGNRCSVYNDRPLICRVFGVAEGLPCSHGCEPSRVMPDDEVWTIIEQIRKI